MSSETKLAAKYDFSEIEPCIQRFWEKEGVYRFDSSRKGEIFSIDTPPPTVSGKLHIGHVFSYTQAEMIARYKRMRGFNVFYPFGFDDNGLPTERLVEKDAHIKAHELPRSEFKKKCLETTAIYEDEFKALFQRLGISADWNLQYRTISEKAQRISQKSFIDLVHMHKAYMKKSPVLWCTECRTSIAQAELEMKENRTRFNYLNFTTEAGPIPVATTRPELLAGCVALFVHPEDERFSRFIGLYAKVPLYDFMIPVMAEKTVEKDKGTGAVMCATFGDAADVSWVEKHRLPVKSIIGPDGRISADTDFIGGMKVTEARETIIRLLEEKGLLIRQETLEHLVAVHERCGKETEFLLSRQWYIDILSEKDRLLAAADEVDWHPAQMKNRYRIWVENLKWDWCISRQRYFGVPIPVWYCKDCGRPMLASADHLPVDPTELAPDGACSCGCREFQPETSVLDTWATSSMTPFINDESGNDQEAGGSTETQEGRIFPMSMRAQAHEIIRTWAFYTIAKSLYHTGKLPWKSIMISGYVLAKPGSASTEAGKAPKAEKISKSKNNAGETPIALIETWSADALRYWSAAGRLGTDTAFDTDDLKTAKRFITKLYNAAKFVQLQLTDFSLQSLSAHLLPVDRWILAQAAAVTQRAADLLDQYEIGLARQEIDHFFWDDFCDYYIDIVKERLYKPEIHGEEARKAAQSALYQAFLCILKLYAVYTPYLTEYLFQQLYRRPDREEGSSLHNLCWELTEPDKAAIRFGESLRETIAGVRRYKAERHLSLKDEIPELTVCCSEEFLPKYLAEEKDLLACTRALKISFRKDNQQD